MLGKIYTVFITMVLLLTLAGCGADEGEATGENEVAAFEITIEGSNWEYDSETYTIPAGEPVAINYVDVEGNHGMGIKDTNVDLKGTGRVIVNLEPGEYIIYCNVMCGTEHENMVSKLIVE